MTNIEAMGKEFISKEVEAINIVKETIGEGFTEAVEAIYNCQGKVVLTGVGKSGIIAKKAAATMSSTGTMAIFLDPSEAIHGGLGVISRQDIVFVLSKSGSSDELIALLPQIKQLTPQLIAMVGTNHSPLANYADIIVPVIVEREACPLNLTPTSSTTAMLIVCDAIALVLLQMRNWTPTDFVRLHPGGALGKRLLLHVSDLMHDGDSNPVVHDDAEFKQIVGILTRTALGGVNVVNKEGKLVGIISDGDVRRSLEMGSKVFDMKAQDLMTRNAVTISPNAMAYDALQIMENRPSQISVLPVIEADGTCVGMLRLHDLFKIGF
jgi:arabinose-5-phosphate isomerase